jgi:hypothetical protein
MGSDEVKKPDDDSVDYRYKIDRAVIEAIGDISRAAEEAKARIRTDAEQAKKDIAHIVEKQSEAGQEGDVSGAAETIPLRSEFSLLTPPAAIDDTTSRVPGPPIFRSGFGWRMSTGVFSLLTVGLLGWVAYRNFMGDIHYHEGDYQFIGTQVILATVCGLLSLWSSARATVHIDKT